MVRILLILTEMMMGGGVNEKLSTGCLKLLAKNSLVFQRIHTLCVNKTLHANVLYSEWICLICRRRENVLIVVKNNNSEKHEKQAFTLVLTLVTPA